MNLNREKHTISIMIGMYCKAKHSHIDGELCSVCKELNEYALLRVERCKFGIKKPVCAQCTVHCYKPEMREKVREVMRYAGPRMIFRHPKLAILHIVDKLRNRKSFIIKSI